MPGGQVSEGNGVGIRIQAFFNGLLIEKILLLTAFICRGDYPVIEAEEIGKKIIGEGLVAQIPPVKMLVKSSLSAQVLTSKPQSP